MITELSKKLLSALQTLDMQEAVLSETLITVNMTDQ
jgi:hypothetical protein